MVWEIVIAVILVMGIVTTVREIRLKKARKKPTTPNEGNQNSRVS